MHQVAALYTTFKKSENFNCYLIIPFVILSDIYKYGRKSINEQQNNNTSKEILEAQSLEACMYNRSK